MHIEESIWLKNQLSKYKNDISPLLNLGSSTNEFRTVSQPFIDEFIFSPLNENEVKVIHSDIKTDVGVDLVGDINEPTFNQSIRSLSVKSVLYSNLLEHVEDPVVMAASILSVLPVDGLIFVTVPYEYPKHLDPIDTMYRPSPKMLEEIFVGTQIVSSQVMSVGIVGVSLLKSLIELSKMVVRSFMPFYKYPGWVTTVNKLSWFFKNRKITCVVLRKIEEVDV